MKDFTRHTLAAMLGVMLASILLTVVTLVSVAGMIAGEEMGRVVQEGSVLRIKLNGEIVERVGEESPLRIVNAVSFMGLLTQSTPSTIGLDRALEALKKAATSENVEGIYLEGGSLHGSPAELRELRRALLDFKKSGKWIVAYGDSYNRSAYYIASVADQVFLNPLGLLDWSGMASEVMFYTGLLEKVGVRMQVFKVGAFKSAVEPYTNKEMSPANREQVENFLGSIWQTMQSDVAQSRKLDTRRMDAISDSITAFSAPDRYVQAGLVDKLCYQDEAKQALRERLGLDLDEPVSFASMKDVASIDNLGEKVDEEIAVYYAYGEIVGQREASFAADHCIVGEEMMRDLQKLRDDDDVKAVVLRVNSPGGSAFISEQIWREVQLLRARKPVVVSMGGMAASGGYYISCGANQIWAEPTTLTGSIGIFGMVPDVSELLTEKLGLTFDVVKTNSLSDFGTLGRPFNDRESRIMQAHVRRGYEVFTNRVAGGRGMAQDSVNAIAEGRVWTGELALRIGLVDRLGNLDDAILSAAKLAGADRYTVGRYPEQKAWYDRLFDASIDDYMESRVRAAVGQYYPAYRFARRLGRMDWIQARLPYEVIIE